MIDDTSSPSPTLSTVHSGTARYGDAEAETAAGMALPSMRALQAAGAIRADKEPKHHGGFRRTWNETDILKAAIGAVLGGQLAWNIRLVAQALAAHRAIWDIAVPLSLGAAERSEILAPDSRLMLAERLDWMAELTDRTFLFLLQPPELMAATGIGTPTILIGRVARDGAAGDRFVPLSSAVLTAQGLAMAADTLGPDAARRAEHHARIALATRANCLGKTTVNISMAVRAAWRRLHGFEARFALQPHEGDPAS
jgi:hypothetical protein